MTQPSPHPQAHTGRIFCFGFYPWKHGYVRKYLAAEGRPVSFVLGSLSARIRGFDARCTLLVWGLRERSDVRRLAARHRVPIWRMEDGFLRSVGLGSDRYAPASLVIDREGIYYDPSAPSQLESILEEGSFSTEELARARALGESIVALEISKYNVGDRRTALPRVPQDKRVVLVPGQVEDDAAILKGTLDVRTNASLLRAARGARPDAFIVFKPHPDVVSGNRKGAVPDAELRALADAVVLDAPLPACLSIAHEVHTMTSLVGFEALLRGIAVSVYGLPFYAGWGLTEDRHTCARRTRRLSLDELIAGTLLRYPIYLHPRTGQRCTPEEIASELLRQMSSQGNRPVRQRWLERQSHKLRNAVRGMLDGL